MNHSSKVAVAFIYQGDQLLLQLRDNKPEIAYPNYWGLFGGHLEPEELPEQGIVREITEELGWIPEKTQFLLTWEEPEQGSLTHVFAIPLTVNTEFLVLTEGQAWRLFTLDELTKFPIVPKILRMLPQVIDLIPSPALNVAWQNLSYTSDL